MKIFNKSDRLGIAWFSHTAEETPIIHLDAPYYCIVQAFVAWSATSNEHTIDIYATGEHQRLAARSSFRHSNDLFLYSADITPFVQLHCNTAYEIRPLESDAEQFRWHMIVVYNCPSQPVRHVCVLLQENGEEQLWEAMQSELPSITAHTNKTAQLHLLGYDAYASNSQYGNLLCQRYDLHLELVAEQIMPNNYADPQASCPHPFIIAQQCPLPTTDMRLEQTTDRAHISLQDIVTCTTKITNRGTIEALYVQYRTTLPACARLIHDSFTINGIQIPISVDSFNVITVILRNMPVDDLLLVSFQMQFYTQPTETKLYHSATLDYHFYAEPNTLSIGNTPSNIVEYVFSSCKPASCSELGEVTNKK